MEERITDETKAAERRDVKAGAGAPENDRDDVEKGANHKGEGRV
jgi:hypothetical protein